MERFLTSDRLIAFHRNKLDIQPYPDDKLNIAYLNQKFYQYEQHLLTSPDELKIITIKEIYKDLQDGDEVYKYSVQYTNILVILFNLLKVYENKDIRIESSFCFKQFCKLNFSRQIFDEIKILTKLESILYDQEAQVRLNVIEGLIFFCSYREGQEAIIKNKVLNLIINKIDNEASELVLFKLLELHYEILKADTASRISLDNGIIQILKKQVKHKKIKIRTNVFKNFASLSMCEHGKEECTNEGSLIKECLDQVSEQLSLNQESLDDSVRKYSKYDSMLLMNELTRFLLAVSILKRGKEEIFKFKGLSYGLELLGLIISSNDSHYQKDDKEQLLLNIIQYIGNTSEDPSSRKFLLDNLKSLEVFLSYDNEFIKEQAVITIKIIKWKP